MKVGFIVFSKTNRLEFGGGFRSRLKHSDEERRAAQHSHCLHRIRRGRRCPEGPPGVQRGLARCASVSHPHTSASVFMLIVIASHSERTALVGVPVEKAGTSCLQAVSFDPKYGHQKSIKRITNEAALHVSIKQVKCDAAYVQIRRCQSLKRRGKLRLKFPRFTRRHFQHSHFAIQDSSQKCTWPNLKGHLSCLASWRPL